MATQRKKKRKSKKKSSERSPLLTQEQWGRIKKITGLALVLFTFFLFVSMVSYLFTWRADQSALMLGSDELYLTSEPVEVENWMGVLGAKLSHFMIFDLFGLASFLWVPLFGVFGLRLLTRFPFSNRYKWVIHTTVVAIMLSVIIALLTGEKNLFYSGVVGASISNWLTSVSGVLGTVLILLFAISVWAMVSFSDLFVKIQALLPQKAQGWFEPKAAAPPNAEEESTYRSDTLFEKDRISVDEEDKQEAEPETDSEEEGSLDFEVRREEESDSGSNQNEAASKEESDMELKVEASAKDETVKSIDRQGLDTLYDPKLDLRDFKFPPIDLLNEYGEHGKTEVSNQDLQKSKDLIVETLKNYKIGISKIKATIGPTVTLFEIVPAPGVKISKIKNLEDDIALNLAALGIRIIAPIPGKGTIGIEVPNKKPEIVSMRSVIASKKYAESKHELPVCLGKTISNEVYVADLAKMPHLLMAGATGQGKSVGLNAILVSLLYRKHPSELKLVLVDPKKVELTLYNKIERHYLAKLPNSDEPIITDNDKVINTLNSLCVEMDLRYALLQKALVRNIKEYNKKFIDRKLNPNDGHRFLPYIVVVIDEVADLIMTAGKEVEHPIGRLAQLARAIGIHLVLATQRPSVNIITGTIKANFPARIAFRVSSKIDSRTILDANGADQLIGRGDLLYSSGSEIIRLQCPFVDTPEVEEITEFVGGQRGYPDAHILPEVQEETNSSSDGGGDLSERDALFEDAARVVVQSQQGSTSMLQRRLKIGYNRAGRIIDQLEQANIVGPFEGSKARDVLLPDEYALEQYLNNMDVEGKVD
jgi:S-DNA-T family DNA segregation ATPase FtsK/SpoIIIE